MVLFSLRTRAVVAAAALALLVTGCGSDSGSGGGGGGAATSTTVGVPVDQTVQIRMIDIAFKPDAVTVKAGTTVRFVFKNTGSIDHEAAFGDEATQKAVEDGKQQRDGPMVGPNRTKDVARRFDTPGTLIIGCHVAGHYAGGMRIDVKIV